jgi:hypothetical protein
MKIILMITGFCIVLFCSVTDAKHGNWKLLKVTSPAPATDTDTVNYATQILPLLQKKCTPCHFAGGKMYERMPFDKSETILSHEAGILKRIKDQPEADLIRQFILQRNK